MTSGGITKRTSGRISPSAGPLLIPSPWGRLRSPFLFADGSGRKDLFSYRRILDKDLFEEEAFQSVLPLSTGRRSTTGWGPIVGVPEAQAWHHLYMAKQLSLSFLYWMQTEAPRHDGGYGYPELRLRVDVVRAQDGLAMYPYVRQSRRIKAEFTVAGAAHRNHSAGATWEPEEFFDSVKDRRISD